MDKKRIAAIVGIAFTAVMVLTTLITAFLDKSGVYFRSCLIVTIALPLAVWFFIWSLGAMTNRHTMASFDLLSVEENEEISDDDETVEE